MMTMDSRSSLLVISSIIANPSTPVKTIVNYFSAASAAAASCPHLS